MVFALFLFVRTKIIPLLVCRRVGRRRFVPEEFAASGLPSRSRASGTSRRPWRRLHRPGLRTCFPHSPFLPFTKVAFFVESANFSVSCTISGAQPNAPTSTAPGAFAAGIAARQRIPPAACFCPESRFRTSHTPFYRDSLCGRRARVSAVRPGILHFFLRKMRDNDFFVYICSPETQIFGVRHLERCRSGRSGRTRNAVYGQLYRGFESLSLRFRRLRGRTSVLPFFLSAPALENNFSARRRLFRSARRNLLSGKGSAHK